MPKVVVTAQVKDVVEWEAGFRTHGDLFRSTYTFTSHIGIAINEGNEIAVCFEPADVATAVEAIRSPATAEAMTVDGVKKETVKVYVFDKEFQP